MSKFLQDKGNRNAIKFFSAIAAVFTIGDVALSKAVGIKYGRQYDNKKIVIGAIAIATFLYVKNFESKNNLK